MYVLENRLIVREKAPVRGDDRGFSESVSALTTSQNDTAAATVDAANPHTSYPVGDDSTSSHVRPYMLPPQPKQQVGHTLHHSNTLRY